MKELKGFRRVFLHRGETTRVSVELNRRAFSYYDEANHRRAADAGDFNILIGPSSVRIVLSGKVTRLN